LSNLENFVYLVQWHSEGGTKFNEMDNNIKKLYVSLNNVNDKKDFTDNRHSYNFITKNIIYHSNNRYSSNLS